MTDSTQIRTLEQAVADVRYGIEFGRLNERFWQRIDTTLNLVQVLAGAMALAGALSRADVLAAAGLAMAVVSALQIALQPGRRAAGFLVARQAFHALNKRAWQFSVDEIDAALEDLRATAPQGLDALALPALNAVNRQHGQAEQHRLHLGAKLAAALA